MNTKLGFWNNNPFGFQKRIKLYHHTFPGPLVSSWISPEHFRKLEVTSRVPEPFPPDARNTGDQPVQGGSGF